MHVHRQLSKSTISSSCNLFRSAISSISTILSSRNVKLNATRSFPPGAQPAAATPCMVARLAPAALPLKKFATLVLPLACCGAPMANADLSALSTHSGSSKDSRASRSPSRAAARNASTILRSVRLLPLLASTRSPALAVSAFPAEPCTRRRARLASCREAVGEVWEQATKHYNETELASLILWITTSNVFNRLNVTTRQVPGAWG